MAKVTLDDGLLTTAAIILKSAGCSELTAEEIERETGVKPGEECADHNAIRSRFEALQWRDNPPDRKFAYVSLEILEYERQAYSERTGRLDPFRRCGAITTWTGEILGSAIFGREYYDNFGGKRRSVRVKGTNGREYSGTYFVSAGTYCRIKAVKSPLEHALTKSLETCKRTD